MRVAVVGGLERHEVALERCAADLGHTVEFHRGHMGGRSTEVLEAVVARCELLIIVTKVNSHGAMRFAKRMACRLARRTVVARTCSPSSFHGLIESPRGGADG
ncbi:MAG TPA: DUF2325 domain-containing protein [Polyangiaceae bacterium]|nr:DUF2325 domain-containing protein [Polyangiaceae bacterium]